MFKKLTLLSLSIFSISVIFAQSKKTITKTEVTIKASVNNTYSGYVSEKEKTLLVGDIITLTATAFDNFQFLKWTGDITEAKILNNTITLTATKNTNIQAVFIPQKVFFTLKDKFNRSTKISGHYSYGSKVDWKVDSPYFINKRIRYIVIKTSGNETLTEDKIVEIKWIKQYFIELKESDDYEITGFPGGWVNDGSTINFGVTVKRPKASFSHWQGIAQHLQKNTSVETIIKSAVVITPILDLKTVNVKLIDSNGNITPFKSGEFTNGQTLNWQIKKNKIIKDDIRLNCLTPTGSIIVDRDLIINPGWYKDFKITINTVLTTETYKSVVTWQRDGNKMAIKADNNVGKLQFSHWSGDITVEQQYQNPLKLFSLNSPREINAHYLEKSRNQLTNLEVIDNNILQIISVGRLKTIKEANTDLVPFRYIDHQGEIVNYGYFPEDTIIDLKNFSPFYENAYTRYSLNDIRPITIGSNKIIRLKWHKEFLINYNVYDLSNGTTISSSEEWERENKKVKFEVQNITDKTFLKWSGDVSPYYAYNKTITVIAYKPLVINLNYSTLSSLVSDNLKPLIKNSLNISVTEIKNWNNYGRCLKLTSKNLETVISIALGQVIYYGLPKEEKNFLWVNKFDESLNKTIAEYNYSGQSAFFEPQKLAPFFFKKDNARLDGVRPDRINVNDNRVELVFSPVKGLNIILKKIFVLGENTLYTKTIFLSDKLNKKSKYLIAPSLISKFTKPNNVLIDKKGSTKLSKLDGKAIEKDGVLKYDPQKNINFIVGTQDSRLIMDYGKHKIKLLTTRKFNGQYPHEDSLITFSVPKNSKNFIEVTTNGYYEYINQNESSYSEATWTLE